MMSKNFNLLPVRPRGINLVAAPQLKPIRYSHNRPESEFLNEREVHIERRFCLNKLIVCRFKVRELLSHDDNDPTHKGVILSNNASHL